MQEVTLFDLLPFSETAVRTNQEDVGGLELKKEALSRVLASADPTWVMDALKVIMAVCEEQEEFSTNDLWPLLPHIKEPRALGAVLNEAAKRRYCRKTDRYEPSNIPRQHRRPISVWESLIYSKGSL